MWKQIQHASFPDLHAHNDFNLFRIHSQKTSMLTRGAWAVDDDERLLGALLEGQYKEPWQVTRGRTLMPALAGALLYPSSQAPGP